jgi:hypothetical protein
VIFVFGYGMGVEGAGCGGEEVVVWGGVNSCTIQGQVQPLGLISGGATLVRNGMGLEGAGCGGEEVVVWGGVVVV